MTSFDLLVYFHLAATLLKVISDHWRGRVTKLGWQPPQDTEQQSPGTSNLQDSRPDECRGQTMPAKETCVGQVESVGARLYLYHDLMPEGW